LRTLPASVANERIASMLPVSQVRIRVDEEAAFFRSVRSEDEERTQARMVFDSSRAS
jgi:hypothetical protein